MVSSMRKFYINVIKQYLSINRILLVLLAIILLIPILFTFFYSFFSPKEILQYLSLRHSLQSDKWLPIKLVPAMASIGQYFHLLVGNKDILSRYIYSLFYAASILFGQALIIPAMAFSLSTFKPKIKNVVFYLLILLMLLPFQVTMLPNMLVLKKLGFLDTIWAIILPNLFHPFYIFLLRQYMILIPSELYEAGQIDGATPIKLFFNVCLPLSKPVIGAAVALSFAETWNLVEQPITFLSHREDLQPLSTLFNILILNPKGIEFAAATLYILPALFVCIFFIDDIMTSIHIADQK